MRATQFEFPKIHIPQDQLDEPIAFIRRTGVPYRGWWSRELRDGSVDALVALLLAQLSSLNICILAVLSRDRVHLLV